MKERKKIMAMLVENNYGVTSRVSGMFSRRGFNLDSLQDVIHWIQDFPELQ